MRAAAALDFLQRVVHLAATAAGSRRSSPGRPSTDETSRLQRLPLTQHQVRRETARSQPTTSRVSVSSIGVLIGVDPAHLELLVDEPAHDLAVPPPLEPLGDPRLDDADADQRAFQLARASTDDF